MIGLKFFLLCFMIAAPQGALGSAAHSHSGAPISRGSLGEISINLPPNSEFVEKRVTMADFQTNVEKDFIFGANTPEGCLSEAISRGVHAFRITFTGCHFYILKNPICNKWKGDTLVYIRKDMLSDGSPTDNATFDLTPYQSFVPDGDLRYYRIESPTILEFGNLRKYGSSATEMFQYFAILDGFDLPHPDSLVLADPSCYTTSTCSKIFLTTAPEIPASDLFLLHDICGQSIKVDSGKPLYVLSHAGIGCKNFPNDYPVDDCWAEFTGAGEITINVTLVNFRESDQCDGFTMAAVTDDANGVSTSTDLCDTTAPTELTSAGGKIRIDFGDSASPTREKYGFNFQVTAA